MAECAFVLGQKKCTAHRKVGVLQIIFKWKEIKGNNDGDKL